MEKPSFLKSPLVRSACFFIFNYGVFFAFTYIFIDWFHGGGGLSFVIWIMQLAFFPLLFLLFFICQRTQSLAARLFFTLSWVFSTANFLELLAVVLYKQDIGGAIATNMFFNMTLLLPIWLILAVIELALVVLFVPQLKNNKPVKYGFIPCFLVSVGVLFFTYLIADTSMKDHAIFIFVIAVFAVVMIFSTQKIHRSSIKHKFLFDYICLSLITILFACVLPPHVGFSLKALIDNIEGILVTPLILSPFLVLMAVVHYKLIDKK